MDHDGNGWVECSLGHRHWGLHGAAGLLLHTVDDAGTVRVLLQHRAEWSHHGGTWGLPGGARDSHEDAVAAALREANEETSLDRSRVRTRHTFVDDHGGWSYTTVYADTPTPLATKLNQESVELSWVALSDVESQALHPGFAATWAAVQARPATLLVDAANVVGSRPDGWWQDRAGATSRLIAALDELRALTVIDPAGGTRVVVRVVVVVEGQAREAGEASWAEVVRADGSGDDAVVAAATALTEADAEIIAVTADRGLRSRVRTATVQVAGPSWLLALMG